MMRILAIPVLLLLFAVPGRAQVVEPLPLPGEPELLDRVVAVVGDTSLLLSDLRTAVQQMQASGQTLPTDPAQLDAFMTALLTDRINTLLLVEAARDAGITVEDAQVTQLVDSNIARILQSFDGSQQRFEAALAAEGLTLSQYRDVLKQQYHDDQLMRSYMTQRMRARARPVISEDEIAAAFETQRSQLGTRPASIAFGQVIVKPVAGDSADAIARSTAEDVLKQLRDGGDWEVLARRFSDDPGSKETGGDIGWVKQGGGLVAPFERAAFALRPGVVSPIVTTEFGYHIIQVRRTQGAERQVRHILIQPDINEGDIERARLRADSVATALRNGAALPALARAYGTPEDEIEIGSRPVSSMPTAYATAMGSAQMGEVVGPFQVPGAGSPDWVVVKVTNREPEREYTVADARAELITRLQEQRMITQIVEELRNSIYVSVSM